MAGRRFPMVTARAVGNMDLSLSLTKLHVAPDGLILLPRGKSDRAVCLKLGARIVDYKLLCPGSDRILALVPA